MTPRIRLPGVALGSLALLVIIPEAQGQTKSSGQGTSSTGSSTSGQGGSLQARAAAAVSGGWSAWMPYYVVATPGGIFTVVPPVVVWGPAGMTPVPAPAPYPVPVAIDRGPIAPAPPPHLIPPPAPEPVEKPARRRDPGRAAQLLTVGDRLFRGDNLKKAEERYIQAHRLDPQSAQPLVRLAQVAFVRERYAEACQRLREAETAHPGWIVQASDIQALYGEPTEFAEHLARLETHLQVHPGDRDAWLVLGAQWFLSGRTERAGDVFLRLKDPNRKPDVALAAFLEASQRE